MKQVVGATQRIFMEQASRLERDWIARLRQCSTARDSVSPADLRKQLPSARRRAAERLLYNLYLEGILPTSGFHWYRLETISSLFRSKEAPEHPTALVAWVAAQSDLLSRTEWLAFSDRVTNHYLNDALATSYRKLWSRKLKSAMSVRAETSFLDYLAGLSDSGEELLFQEQWAARGHPIHPLAKAKIDLEPAEVIAYAPDFRRQVELRWLALRTDRAHVELSNGIDDYTAWLADLFPRAMQRWHAEMKALGCNPTSFIPLPAHPWQISRRIQTRFAAHIAERSLILIRSATSNYSPLTSLRTLTSTSDPRQPDIKLPVDILITSVRRTISPRTCQMSPRIGSLLRQLLQRDTALSTHLRLQPEICGVHYKNSAKPEEEKQLAAVFRQPSGEIRRSGEYLVPCTALLADSPYNGKPLVAALIARRFGSVGPDEVRRFFSDYIQHLLPGLLRLYLVYGIALEAHQQNTILVLSRDHRINGFVLRDLGGIRLHRPSIINAGLSLRLHEDRLTVPEDRESLHHNLLSVVMFLHLGQFVMHLQRTTGTPSDLLWAQLRSCLRVQLDILKPEVRTEIWVRERRRLLEEDWKALALTRINLDGGLGRLYLSVPNPLRNPREHASG